MSFDPAPDDLIQVRIGGATEAFRFPHHPSAPSYVHAMEGGQATVYRLVSDSKSDASGLPFQYALKVMKYAYASPELATITQNLDRLKTLPGMRVCERRCLTPVSAPATLQQYPELSYSIIMPWIQGKSWFECLMGSKNGTFTLTMEESFALARDFCAVIGELEKNGFAHCDLSAGNVLLDPKTLNVNLVDVEDVFAPGFHPPSVLPAGTPGYQHRSSTAGQWSSDADRFSTAILLSEMLALYDADAVRTASLESFFDPHELQTTGSQRLPVLKRALNRHSNRLAGLLDRAWSSNSFAQCPPIAEWRQALDSKHVQFVPLAAPALTPRFEPFWNPLEFTEQPATVRFTEPLQPDRKTVPVIRWEQ